MDFFKIFNKYHLLVFGLFLIICGYQIFGEGMFMDGLIYSSISRNMAEGKGVFWQPFFSETMFYPFFKEHPPLAFGIQRVFFQIFGDNQISEGLYALFNFLISSWGIILIWNKITGQKENSWLPVLIWISIPTVIEGFKNGLLEIPMSMFLVFSVYYYLHFYSSNKIHHLVISGFLIFLGFITKGFPSLFIWSLPFWMYIARGEKNFLSVVADTFLIVLFTIFPFLLLYIFNDSAIESILAYINHQVIGSIQKVATVDSRFHIIYDFVSALLIPIAILFFIILIQFKKIKKLRLFNKNVNWLFLLALSGVLPIMISMKQRPFYIIAVYPYVAIYIAYIILIHNSLKIKLSSYIVGLITIIGISISILGANSVDRDIDMIHDINEIQNIIPENSIIKVEEAEMSNWSLHGYFMRKHHVSIFRRQTKDVIDESKIKYFLSKSLSESPDLKLIKKLNIYYLYEVTN